jgi:hypothetical protein
MEVSQWLKLGISTGRSWTPLQAVNEKLQLDLQKLSHVGGGLGPVLWWTPASKPVSQLNSLTVSGPLFASEAQMFRIITTSISQSS